MGVVTFTAGGSSEEEREGENREMDVETEYRCVHYVLTHAWSTNKHDFELF